MPELPEVETVRAGLEPLITGARIVSVAVYRDSAVRLLPGGAGQFSSQTADARVAAVVRRGKFMWWPLGFDGQTTPTEALSAHLGMSGQFRVHSGPWDAAPEPHRHCRVRLHLDGDAGPVTVDFLDQRTFGYLHTEALVETPDSLPGGAGHGLAAVPMSVAHIGRDALDPHLKAADVVQMWRRGQRGIKQVLLDQTRVSGIGNIYADEALWLARIHPQRPAASVSTVKARELFEASATVMASALSQGGTSFDQLYVNVNGESGYFARSLEAYGREGEPCTRCGGLIRRERIGGRSTHWCPRCQRRTT